MWQFFVKTFIYTKSPMVYYTKIRQILYHKIMLKPTPTFYLFHNIERECLVSSDVVDDIKKEKIGEQSSKEFSWCVYVNCVVFLSFTYTKNSSDLLCDWLKWRLKMCSWYYWLVEEMYKKRRIDWTRWEMSIFSRLDVIFYLKIAMYTYGDAITVLDIYPKIKISI